MAYGLQVFDTSGSIVMDTSTRLGRILGTATITTVNGSISNSAFSQGTAFWTVYTIGGSGYEEQPSISVAGSTLSWTWTTSGAAWNADCLIIYGVY